MDFGKAKEALFVSATALWAVLAPIHTLMYSVLLVIGVDLITGIWKSVKVDGERVTSRRLRETVAKLAVYLLVMLSGFAADKIMGGADPMMSRLVSLGLVGIELKSADENLKALGYDVLGSLIARLKPPPKS